MITKEQLQAYRVACTDYAMAREELALKDIALREARKKCERALARMDRLADELEKEASS